MRNDFLLWPTFVLVKTLLGTLTNNALGGQRGVILSTSELPIFLLQSEICWSTQWLPHWLTQQGSGSWYHYLKFASKWARNVLMQCLTSLVRDRLCALQRCFFTEENWIPIRGNNWWQDIEDLWGSFFEWIGGKVCPHWWRHICVHQKHTIQSIPVPITDLNLAYWIRIVCIIKTQ